MVLPTLLQIALVLFFAGLLELLWTLNHTVSIVAAVFVAILGLFQLVTTVLPASVPDCPYQSPQALGFIILVKLSRLAIGKICRRSWNYVMNCCGDDLPVAFHWQDRGLWTARRKFALSVRRYIHYIDNWLNMVVAEKRLYNWRERERMIVDSNGEMLDTRMLIAADLTFTDNAFLETVVRRCLTGMKVEGATQCFHRIVDHCSKHPWQVSALQHGIKVDRSGAALINIALDIIMMVEPHRLHNSTVLPLLRFLSTNMRWTSPSSSTQWQQLFDVGVSLLCNEWNEIRYLAFDITAFSFRVAPELNKVTLSSSGLQAMASYLEFSEVKGDKWRSLVATDLLLDCAASNCLSDVDLNAVQADVQKPLRDFFCLWEMVPLVDHPSYVLLGIGTSFVQFARRNTGHVEIGLIEVIVRMFSAYGTANVFSNEAERQAKEKLVNLLLDLDAILNWYMLAELPGP
ncbi:hypothetical protein SCP_0800950 [Sparassis crispa]|uniref:Uncharacterized protein n=1 Tax=Sparassis crispa TaxID=139825 RepID=A0A401GTM8_9APHY|nr:hypothetical protein SCP_0800950 [Sparassis crispa]GBE85578.1 hypothetical protein SCP_0800950 [Sparassis crispa]